MVIIGMNACCRGSSTFNDQSIRQLFGFNTDPVALALFTIASQPAFFYPQMSHIWHLTSGLCGKQPVSLVGHHVRHVVQIESKITFDQISTCHLHLPSSLRFYRTAEPLPEYSSRRISPLFTLPVYAADSNYLFQKRCGQKKIGSAGSITFHMIFASGIKITCIDTILIPPGLVNISTGSPSSQRLSDYCAERKQYHPVIVSSIPFDRHYVLLSWPIRSVFRQLTVSSYGSPNHSGIPAWE